MTGADLATGTAMIFGGLGGAGDVLGDSNGGTPEGEPLAEYLEIEIVSPGRPIEIVRRALFDRIADIRNEATPDISAIEPIKLETMADGSHHFVPLASLIALGVTTGSVPEFIKSMPTTYDAEWLALLHSIYDINRARQFYATSDRGPSSLLYVDRPNVHAHIHAPETDQSGAYTHGRLTADLLYTSGAGRSGDDSIPFGILDGVVAQRAEQDMLDARIIERVSAAVGLELPQPVAQASIGTLFGQALAGARDLTVLISDADLAAYDGSFAPTAATIVRAHLAAGRILIVPTASGSGDPVPGWWVYDPATSRIRDEVATGQSAAALIFQAVEYSFKIKVAAFAAKLAFKAILGHALARSSVWRPISCSASDRS